MYLNSERYQLWWFVECVCVRVCVLVLDCFSPLDTAVLLRTAGWRPSRARNISYNCRPKSIEPPWSTPNPADFTAAAASEAASRSGCGGMGAAPPNTVWLQLMGGLRNVKCDLLSDEELQFFSTPPCTVTESPLFQGKSWLHWIAAHIVLPLAQLLLIATIFNVVKLKHCFVRRKRQWATTRSRRPNWETSTGAREKRWRRSRSAWPSSRSRMSQWLPCEWIQSVNTSYLLINKLSAQS